MGQIAPLRKMSCESRHSLSARLSTCMQTLSVAKPIVGVQCGWFPYHRPPLGNLPEGNSTNRVKWPSRSGPDPPIREFPGAAFWDKLWTGEKPAPAEDSDDATILADLNSNSPVRT